MAPEVLVLINANAPQEKYEIRKRTDNTDVAF
jgi:hypothetical protein